MMRTLFDDKEIVDLAEPFPNLGELPGKQFAKEWTDANVREIIAASSNRSAVARIIALLRMVKRLLHEPGKGLWAAPLYFSADELDKLSLQLENVERPTSNVQCREC